MFCLNFYPFKSYIQGAEEFKIKYNPSDQTLKDFLEKYQQKSIVIDATENLTNFDINLFKELSKKYQNIKLIISYENKEVVTKVQENEIPFFFSNFVTTGDQMYGLMKYNPTDMYICEDLGFSLDKVSEILHKNNIKVRVFPNICQSSFNETDSLKTFFIRPEDIDIYSTFVDVFELIADENTQQILYKVYKQQKWFGPIKEIIPSFKGELDGRYILDSFGRIRSKCGKKCLFKPETCSICDRFIDLAETLKKNDLIVKKIKNED